MKHYFPMGLALLAACSNPQKDVESCIVESMKLYPKDTITYNRKITVKNPYGISADYVRHCMMAKGYRPTDKPSLRCAGENPRSSSDNPACYFDRPPFYTALLR